MAETMKVAKAKSAKGIPTPAPAPSLLKLDASERAIRTARLIKASKAIETKRKSELKTLVSERATSSQPRAAAANDGFSAAERIAHLRERILAKRPRSPEQSAQADGGEVAANSLPARKRLREKTRDPELSR